MKSDLKFLQLVYCGWCPVYRNYTGNNGTSGTLGKNCTFSTLDWRFGIWRWSL